jgi:hypothetical protein
LFAVIDVHHIFRRCSVLLGAVSDPEAAMELYRAATLKELNVQRVVLLTVTATREVGVLSDVAGL